jgi:hypothetical protein
MKRETRDKFASGTDQTDLTTGNACWETAPKVFEKLNRDFGRFDIDLTADVRRALCSTWFGPGSKSGDDALTAIWNMHGRNGYSNPPYGPFVARMLERARYWASQDFRSTLLLPMRVTIAFRAHILPAATDLLFCSSRLYFFEDGAPRLNEKNWIKHGRATADSALFDSIVVRFGPGRTSLNVGEWKVPDHVSPDDLERAVEIRRRREQSEKEIA